MKNLILTFLVFVVTTATASTHVEQPAQASQAQEVPGQVEQLMAEMQILRQDFKESNKVSALLFGKLQEQHETTRALRSALMEARNGSEQLQAMNRFLSEQVGELKENATQLKQENSRLQTENEQLLARMESQQETNWLAERNQGPELQFPFELQLLSYFTVFGVILIVFGILTYKSRK